MCIALGVQTFFHRVWSMQNNNLHTKFKRRKDQSIVINLGIVYTEANLVSTLCAVL
jgi:hypothetical protein